MEHDHKKRIIRLKKRIVAHFDTGNWTEIGLLTGLTEMIDLHPRLIRSLKWEYNDYAENVLDILNQIGLEKIEALDDIEKYLDEYFPEGETGASAALKRTPSKFASQSLANVDAGVEHDLVAIVMPFDNAFHSVNDTLKAACADAGYRALRPDDIWEQSTIMEEIINLLYRAAIVVADFTGRNPNVMYETGIAHALGKLVIPISQTLDDIPFDVAHHRILEYSSTRTGLFELQQRLAAKLSHVKTSYEAASI